MSSSHVTSRRGGKVVLARTLAGGLAFSTALIGCAPALSDANEETRSSESELAVSALGYLGPIGDGESKTSDDANPSTYRAFGFSAKGGDAIVTDVASDGDAMGWITTTSYVILASNDDASPFTTDSHVVYTVPAGAPDAAYRVVFRDRDRPEAGFTVKLAITSAPPATCTSNGTTYPAGATFYAYDGCNTCACEASGSISCTTRVCMCNPEAEPWRSYVGTPLTCPTVRYSCKPTQRSFQNACGCGCENLSH